jgi:hypothetical protein
MSDFQIIFAIMIAIENHSGKIRDRFSLWNRILFFRQEPIHKKSILGEMIAPLAPALPPARGGRGHL